MILPERFPIEIYELALTDRSKWLSAEAWQALRRLGVEKVRLPEDPRFRRQCEMVLETLAALGAVNISGRLLDQRACDLGIATVWERGRWQLFERYVRQIELTPVLQGDSPFQVCGDILKIGLGDEDTVDAIHEAWHSLRSGRICINLVSVAFGESSAKVTPVPLRFTPASCAALSENTLLQYHIARAYWQTVWAEGALRQQKGETEPVAFFPVLRGPTESEQPTEVLAVDPQRILVGRETILRYWLAEACSQGILLYHPLECRFEINRSRRPGDPDRYRDEALNALNRRGFVDRWVSENRTMHESGRPFVVRRLVDVAGSEVLSKLAPQFRSSPFVPRSVTGARLLAASNSVFFLNFPEEYRNLHAAMNDLVGLLIIDGEMWQPPVLRRAAMLIDEQGGALVAIVSMADCALDLGGSIGRIDDFVLNPETPPLDRPAVYTPIFVAHLPPEHNRTPPVHGCDLVIVDQRVVEVREAGGAEIPMNGLVLSLPGADSEWLVRHLWDYGARVKIDLELGHLGLSRIHTALAAGPQLVRDGQPLRRDYLAAGPEEFFPARFGIQGPLQSGVPPTRFPHQVAKTRAPRTAMGLTADGRILMMTVDGRNPEHSVGMTLLEVSRFLCRLGCREALNLDGGGSTVMYVSPELCDCPVLSPEVPDGVANWPSDSDSHDRLIPAPLGVFDSEATAGMREDEDSEHANSNSNANSN